MQNSCSDDLTWEDHLITMCETWDRVGSSGRWIYKQEIKQIAEALDYLNSLEGVTCRIVPDKDSRECEVIE